MKGHSFLIFIFILISISLKAEIQTIIVNEPNLEQYTIVNPFSPKDDIIINSFDQSPAQLSIFTETYKYDIVYTKNFNEIVFMECGDLVDGSLYYNIEGWEYNLSSFFNSVQYIGFRFYSNGEYYYAYMKLQFNENDNRFTMLEYSYEDIPNKEIAVCDVGFVNVQNESTYNTSIFPNPAIDQLQIDLGNLTEVDRVRIFDGQGQCQMEQDFNGNTSNLSVESLTSGLYMLSFYHENRYQISIPFVKM